MFRMSTIINNASVPLPMINTHKFNSVNMQSNNVITTNTINGSMINRIKGLKPCCSSCGKK